MIFIKTLRQELGRNFGVTLLALLSIVLTLLLIRTLAFVSNGRVGPSDTALFLLYSVLAYLPMLTTLALFIAMVAVLSRLYHDSEMAVWMSSGVGLWTFRKPLLGFALPAVLGILWVALVLWPWSNQHILDLRDRFAQRSIFDRIEPGRFQESADGLRVVYIDNSTVPANDAGGKSKIPALAKNVFVAGFEPGSASYTAAPLGFSENSKGRLVIALQNGHQLRVNSATAPSAENPQGGPPTLDLIGFQQFEVTLDNTALMKAANNSDTPPRALNSWDLVQGLWAQRHANHDDAKLATAPLAAELFWRISFALAAFNAVFMAMAVVVYHPRMRWSPHLLYAFIAFFAYYNGINTMENRLMSGKSNLLQATLFLHGGVLLFSLFWITLRQNPRLQRWLWPRHLLRRPRLGAHP